jgi:hypothetical protein
MPISYPTAFTQEKNQLESSIPFTFLFETKIRTGTNPDVFSYLRHTNYDQNITFDSNTFVAFPLRIGSLNQNTDGQITRMNVSVSNIDQAVTALLESNWVSVVEPLWTVKIWIINADSPSDTPVNNYEEFEVLSVVTNLFVAEFELRTQGISLTRITPGRVYSRNNGFIGIPRLIR